MKCGDAAQFDKKYTRLRRAKPHLSLAGYNRLSVMIGPGRVGIFPELRQAADHSILNETAFCKKLHV
jgi:hypothetical protein